MRLRGRPRPSRCALALAAAALLIACGGDNGVAPFTPAAGPAAERMYWALTLNHAALTLSTVPPYDTARLTATLRDAQGDSLPFPGTVSFRSDDSARVAVDSTGLVHALAPVSNLTVTVVGTAEGTHHETTLLINVVSDSAPAVPVHLSIQPVPPDSTTLALTGDGRNLRIRYGRWSASPAKFLPPPAVTDTAGNQLNSVAVACTSSDTTILAVRCVGGLGALLYPHRPGRVRIAAAATAFGRTLVDTVDYTVTMPVFAVVWLEPMPGGTLGSTVIGTDPPEVTIVPGGTVVWGNLAGEPIDLRFDDSVDVAAHGTVSCANARAVDPGDSGNVAPFGAAQDPTQPLSADNCRSRSFPTPGTYAYHSALTGLTGRIVVIGR